MRLRGHKDMLNDPQFPFMVGRIVGACEAAAILLQSGKLSADELTDVGVKLDEVAAWFLDRKPEIVRSEQPTVVKAP